MRKKERKDLKKKKKKKKKEDGNLQDLLPWSGSSLAVTRVCQVYVWHLDSPSF